MRVRLLDLAGADLIDGYRFYELQAAGVGEYFFNTLAGEISSLRQYAGIHQRVRGYYRMLSGRFPYAVYYTLEADEVSIWRVLDCRRDPRCVPTGTQRASPASTSVEARDCLLLSRIPAGSPNN